MNNKILVVDKTGRGNSICEAFIQNSEDNIVYYLSGTGGFFHKRINLINNIEMYEHEKIFNFCIIQNIDMVVISHIEALVSGLSDFLRAKGILVIGTSKKSTILETDKLFCKNIMFENNIPTAKIIAVCSSKNELIDFLHKNIDRVVIKFNWLTIDGDGAIVIDCNTDRDTIIKYCQQVAESNGNYFKFLIEEFIPGYDYSAHFLVCKDDYLSFPTALDYKKSDNNNLGKNCDGMGSMSPHPKENDSINNKIIEQILLPLFHGLKKCNIEYSGFLYLGIRVYDNQPYLLEINTRFGDSEAEAIFKRIDSDIYCDFKNLYSGTKTELLINKNVSVSVALVQGKTDGYAGWPYGKYLKGNKITFDKQLLSPEVSIAWAGVKNSGTDIYVSSGRVAHIIVLSDTVNNARVKIYQSIKAIRFHGMTFREDIGLLS